MANANVAPHSSSGLEQQDALGFFRTPEAPHDEIMRIRTLLALTHRLVGWDEAPLRTEKLDFQSAEAALKQAQDALSRYLTRREDSTVDSDSHAQAVALLNQLGQAQVFLRDAMLSERSATLARVQQALQRLRQISSLSDLVDRAPAETDQLGFPRTLISRIHNSLWIARAGHIRDDAELTAEMVRVGSENPRKLGPELLETEMLRRRVPLMVHDPQSNPRVHPELVTVTNTQSYVAAPIVSGNAVIGFIHADCYNDYRHVEPCDRDLLGLFAEGLGYAIERTIFFERLQQLRQKLNEYATGVSDLVDGFVGADVHMTTTETESRPQTPRNATSTLFGRSPEDNSFGLTRRELDILRHMAAGETNARIASSLVISEGTVKSHVKHILRKLCAANRAEAVSRYLNMAQQEQERNRI